jgi:putative DNA primase/helicase
VESCHALEGHFAKYRKLSPALALINHLADGGEGAVGQTALRRALALTA